MRRGLWGSHSVVNDIIPVLHWRLLGVQRQRHCHGVCFEPAPNVRRTSAFYATTQCQRCVAVMIFAIAPRHSAEFFLHAMRKLHWRGKYLIIGHYKIQRLKISRTLDHFTRNTPMRNGSTRAELG